MDVGSLAAWVGIALTLITVITGAVAVPLRRRAKKREIAENIACLIQDLDDGQRMVAVVNGSTQSLYDVCVFVQKVATKLRPGALIGERIGTENIGPKRTERFPIQLGAEDAHLRLEVMMYFRVGGVLWILGTDGTLVRSKNQKLSMKWWVRGPAAPEPATVEMHDGAETAPGRGVPAPTPTYTRQAMREAAGNDVTVLLVPEDLIVERAGNATLSDEQGKPLLSVELSDEGRLVVLTIHNAGKIRERFRGLMQVYSPVDDSQWFLFQDRNVEHALQRVGKGYPFPDILGEGETPGAVVYDQDDNLLLVRIASAHKKLHPSYFEMRGRGASKA